MLIAPFLAFLLDGMPIENGRFAGGPVTVLALSHDQTRALRGYRSSKELVLSEAQRVALRRSAGAAPLKLLIYDTTKGENDCSCEARNIGLWFRPDQLEVPHLYLVAEGAIPAGHNGPFLGIACAAAWLVVAGGGVIARRIIPRKAL